MLATISRILNHLGKFVPTSADSVEVKHGQMQWSVAKRGSQFVKKGKPAVETAMLHNIIKSHCISQEEVSKHTLPPPRVRAGITKRVGRLGRNQHSKAQLLKGVFSGGWVAVLFLFQA